MKVCEKAMVREEKTQEEMRLQGGESPSGKRWCLTHKQLPVKCEQILKNGERLNLHMYLAGRLISGFCAVQIIQFQSFGFSRLLSVAASNASIAPRFANKRRGSSVVRPQLLLLTLSAANTIMSFLLRLVCTGTCFHCCSVSIAFTVVRLAQHTMCRILPRRPCIPLERARGDD